MLRSRLERRLIRIAFTTRDPVLRHGIVEALRLAYSKEFLEAVKGQEYRNPDTDKLVKFVSLPPEEQKKIYQQWESKKKNEPKSEEPEADPADDGEEKPAPKKPSGKHKDRKELRGAGKKKLSDPVKIDDELKSLLTPEGMDPQNRERAGKQLAEASYELLNMLYERTAKALGKPEGKVMKSLLKSGYTPEALEKAQTQLKKHLADTQGRKYTKDVLEIANTHDLEGEDADELRDFKSDKPVHGKKLTPQELMQKFLKHAKPETRDRMQGMPIGDFIAMYKAIMAESGDEDVEGGKLARELKQPHDVMQKALSDGRLADDEEDEDGAKNGSALSAEDRTILRLARGASNPVVHRQLLALLSR